MFSLDSPPVARDAVPREGAPADGISDFTSAVEPPRDKPQTRGGFTEAFRQSGSTPKPNTTDVDRTPSAEFFKSVRGSDLDLAQSPAGKPGEQGPSNFFSSQESSPTPMRSTKPEERSAPDDFFRPVDRESRQENPLATRVVNPADLKAAPLGSGPSEYTRWWNRSQLRDLQTQQAAPAGGASAPSAQPPPQALPTPPNVPAPGPPPTMPGPVAAPQYPPYPQMPAPQVAWPPVSPSMPPMPKGEPLLRNNATTLMKYLPLIIGLNALFLIALLLIVLFALKR